MARLIDSLNHQLAAWQRLESAQHGGRTPHALAFTGGGSSSAELAWAFTQRLVCTGETPPCGTCGPCLRVAHRQSEAVLLLEPEKGVIKLEAAHRIGEFLSLQRMTKARVILIQDAQSLNVQATNAILKLVEEPPPETFFLFVVPEISLLLPTLRSRLQVIRVQAGKREWPEECRELAEPVSRFLAGCFRGERSVVAELLAVADDRVATEWAARTLQLALRDWMVREDQGETLNSELSFTGWPERTAEQKVALWRRAWAMELDLAAHVDRTLVFENFYLRTAYEMD